MNQKKKKLKMHNDENEKQLKSKVEIVNKECVIF